MATFWIYKRDDDGRWRRWPSATFPDAKGAPQHWKTQAAAVTYAKKEIGIDWNVRPAKARYAKSQPQDPRPSTRAQKKTASAKMRTNKARQGYVADGRLEGGGEYRWTVKFPNAENAQDFALAIAPEVRSFTAKGTSVTFASSPNHWPGTLFAAEIERFGGTHPYTRDADPQPSLTFPHARVFWIYVDGKKDTKAGRFGAKSSDKAIDLWRRKTGRHDVAAHRLSASPLPTTQEEADWRGETELSDEAVSEEDRADYEAELKAKRSRAAKKTAKAPKKRR
jgi:hypothetical protein